jgi:hypothetical protein
MSVRAFEGVVEGGFIRVPEQLHLAEKTKVYIIIPESETRTLFQVRSPRLLHPEQASDFRKEIVETS